jgi:hypothetical protein
VHPRENIASSSHRYRGGIQGRGVSRGLLRLARSQSPLSIQPVKGSMTPLHHYFPPLRRQFRPTEINAGFSIIKTMRCSCCLLHIATCMPTAYRPIHKLSWPPIVLFVWLVNKQTSNPGREVSVIVSFVYATALGGAMCRREERSRVERREETCAKVRTDQEVRRG